MPLARLRCGSSRASGRVLEVYDDALGDALELGVITVWEPGTQLTYRSLVDDTEVELHHGNGAVLLVQLDGARPQHSPVTHMPWVYVDDVDAHFAEAKAAGATIVSEIEQYGYRAVQARPTME